MTDIQHISNKDDKKYLFEVQLNWLVKKWGVLRADDVSTTLHVATPQKFGGEGKEWGPEHLFLGSLSSSFMATFLFFAQKTGFEILNFECDVIGQVEIIAGHYQFTHIDLFPKVYIDSEELREKANLALYKTQKYCLVSNAIKTKVIYHSEVLTEMQTEEILKEIRAEN